MPTRAAILDLVADLEGLLHRVALDVCKVAESEWFMSIRAMLAVIILILVALCRLEAKSTPSRIYSGLSRRLGALSVASSLVLSPMVCTGAAVSTTSSSVSIVLSSAELTEGITRIDGEALRLFTKARQCESDGLYKDAQEFYEQVVQAEPDFIFGWANLGNVLTQQGNLKQGLLCYRKALSLRPSGEQLSVILLNTASTELSLGMADQAVRDIGLAEKVVGPTPLILTNKAVALTQGQKWQEGVELFEKVFKTSEKDALPWWLRYSMALLETNRGTESVAYLQRTLQRFPYETECKAFATALYTSLGSKTEASRYWKQMKPEEQVQYSDAAFLEDTLKWGPEARKAMENFKSSKYAKAQ